MRPTKEKVHNLMYCRTRNHFVVHYAATTSGCQSVEGNVIPAEDVPLRGVLLLLVAGVLSSVTEELLLVAGALLTVAGALLTVARALLMVVGALVDGAEVDIAAPEVLTLEPEPDALSQPEPEPEPYSGPEPDPLPEIQLLLELVSLPEADVLSGLDVVEDIALGADVLVVGTGVEGDEGPELELFPNNPNKPLLLNKFPNADVLFP